MLQDFEEGLGQEEEGFHALDVASASSSKLERQREEEESPTKEGD